MINSPTSFNQLKPHLPSIIDMFHTYEDLFKRKPHNPANNDRSFVNNVSTIQDDGFTIHYYHGRCFPITKFLYYFLGGRANPDITIKSQRKKLPYITLSNGTELKTTHWWLEDLNNNRLDIAGEQFIYQYPVEQFYENSITSDFGRPYWGNYAKRSKTYSHVVPSNEVIRFAKQYKLDHGSACGLDYWLAEYQLYLDQLGYVPIRRKDR